MKRSGTGRVLATLFLGVVFGIYKHVQQMGWLKRGREVFLADQSRLFDNVARVHSVATTLVVGVVLAIAVFGVYELTAAGFTKIFPPVAVEE